MAASHENLEKFNDRLNAQFGLVRGERNNDKNIDDIHKTIKEAYKTAGNPAAFSSPENIRRYFLRKGKKIKRRHIEQALRSVDAYILHKEHKGIRNRNPFFVHSKREQAQFDLCDVRSLAKDNNNVTFLLTVIDIFTKKLFVRALKKKNASLTEKAIRSILDEMEINGKLRKAFMDRGKEFKNKKVQRLFDSRGIKYFYSTGDLKASVVERVNGSLKQLMFKYMEDKKTYKYIDKLDYLVETYNNRPHRSLKFMTPNDAELPINQNHVLNAHFERYTKTVMKGMQPKFQIGNTVILKNIKEPFQKGYHRRYNTEIFKIVEVDPIKPVPMYTIQSTDDDDVIEGRVYEDEIQLVDKKVYRIIVHRQKTHHTGPRRGKKSFFVSWEGFSSAHDQWINESDIEN